MMTTCPKCNSTTIDQGTLVDGGGYNYYWSKQFSKLKNMFSYIKTHMYVCLSCGYSEMYTDIDALKKKLR